jgi:hypothetical protein
MLGQRTKRDIETRIKIKTATEGGRSAATEGGIS